MKTLFSCFFFILIFTLLSSCAVNKYDYYYSILKSADKNETRESAYNDIFYMQTKPDSLQADFISFYIHTNGLFIDFYVENTIPVYIDYPKTKIIVNDTIYRLNAFDVDEQGIKYYEPIEKRPDVLNEQDWFGSIQLPDDFYYNLYKKYENDNYQRINYKINHKATPIPTIQFSEENTPVFIRAEIVYYTDSVYTDTNMAEATIHQSKILKMIDVREDKKSLKIYELGTGIANEMPDISFYTRNKTGKIWGWPEVQTGLLKAGVVTLTTIAAIAYIALDIQIDSE